MMLSGSPSIHVMNLTRGADIGAGNPGTQPHVLGLANQDSSPAAGVIEAAPSPFAPHSPSTFALPATLDLGNAAGRAVIETPSASVAPISAVGSLQGTFVATGILTIGGPLLPTSSAQAGGAISSGGGTVNVSDSASASKSATGSGAAGTIASNPSSSAAGAVATRASAATAASNATNTPGNATTTANPGTTTNTASGASSSSTGGGIPVVTGQLTLVYGTVASNAAPSGGLTSAPGPVPAITDTFAGKFEGLHGALAGGFSDTISNVSTIIFSQNTNGTSPVKIAGALLANAGGSATALSTLMGISGSPIIGQTGNPADGASLSTVTVTAAIANSAPSSIVLGRGQDISKPETITFDRFAGARELPGSTVPDTVGIPASADAVFNAGREVDLDLDGDVFLTDQAVSSQFTAPTVMSASAATDSDIDVAEIGPLTTSDSVSPIDPLRGDYFTRSVGELVIIATMLASRSVNLAYGGTISNHGSTSWPARHWPQKKVSDTMQVGSSKK